MNEEISQISFTGAGVFAALCTLVGAVITQLFNMRKTVLSMLVTRVTNLEAMLEVERTRCDEKFAQERQIFEERLAAYRAEIREQDQERFAELLKALHERRVA